MSRQDALRLWWRERAPGEIRVRLKANNREIYLRGATTDIGCLEKVFFNREYELPFDLSPEVIFAAGANIGMATLWFSHVYPKARIFVIEREPSNFKQLVRNCRGLPNVYTIQAAVWSKAGQVAIVDTAGEADAFSVSEVAPEIKKMTVPAMTLDGLMKEYDIRHIDLLKMDIEGAERDLFIEDCCAWIDHVTCIAIELHDRFRPGCAKASCSKIIDREFCHAAKGENVFVRFMLPDRPSISYRV